MRSALSLALVALLSLAPAAGADSPVAAAAQRRDSAGLRGLLQKGADVNAAQGDGMTALHWAAQHGDAEIADMLVYAGANPKAVTRIGHYTPLHIACREGNVEVVQRLLRAGADANGKTTTSGVTPLHLAALSGSAQAVALLLDQGADANAREAVWGQTPLMFAAAENRVEAINVLLRRGADPALTTKVVDVVAEAKLAAAATARQRSVLAALHGRGDRKPSAPAELEAAVLAAREVYLSGRVPAEPAGTDEEDAEPAYAGRAGRAGRGARGGGAAAAGGQAPDPNARLNDDGRLPPLSTKGGMTALLHAARQGHVASAQALLDGGAKINQVGAGDSTSPLLMAVINGQYDLALVLIARGADPNLAAAVNGVAPLWAAVNSEWQPRTRFPQPQEHARQQATYLDVMEALLRAGAKPNTRLTKHPWYMVYTGCGNQNCGLEDMEGSTAFWRAAYATDVAAMRLLVKYGADPKIPTKAQPPRPRRESPLDRADKGGAVLRQIQPIAPGLWPATNAASVEPDPSGLPPLKEGGPGVYAIHAASGVGYGEGFAGNAHRHAPDAWLAAVKYLVEELGADVNARDDNGYTPLHHAAARGDDEMILYLVSKGADVTAVARTGQTTADMANGPVQRVSPFPKTVALLEKLGSKNNHRCVSC